MQYIYVLFVCLLIVVNVYSFDVVMDSTHLSFPLIIHPFHLSTQDPFNHLLLFDIDSLLSECIHTQFESNFVKILLFHLFVCC